NRLSLLEGAAINEAKQVLAYEVTKLVHGEDAANQAQIAALKMFSQRDADNIPAIEVADAVGKKLLDVLAAAKIIESKAEGRRLIAQNGLTLNDEKVSDVDYVLGSADFVDGTILVRKGKKKFFKLSAGNF
ncbi:MAG: tyrosine--tRNA ligase, partial [Selenomonadaceae bacterium]|nr:tyrosine--tRNA ligase [Selenomonadaceae bacterium]